MKHFLKELLKKYGHIWILGYGFIYLPWFMHLEKTVTSNYHIMWWRLCREYVWARSAFPFQPSPHGEGAPKGRIGCFGLQKEGENREKSTPLCG